MVISEDANRIVDVVDDPGKILEVPADNAVWITTDRHRLAQVELWRRDAALYRRQLRDLCAMVGVPPKSAVYRGRQLLGFTVPPALLAAGAPPGWQITNGLLSAERATAAQKASAPGKAFGEVEFAPRLDSYVSGLRLIQADINRKVLRSYQFLDAGAALLIFTGDDVEQDPDRPSGQHGFELIAPRTWAKAREYAADDLDHLQI